MKTRYFRHLFQNEKEGIIQIGSIWDNTKDQWTTYVYSACSFDENHGSQNLQRPNEEDWKRDSLIESGAEISLCVLACYTYPNIIRILEMLRRHKTHYFFLPYLNPEEREKLAEEVDGNYKYRGEILRFLKNPYGTLKESGAENVYFIQENGNAILENPQALETLGDGVHCESMEPQRTEQIHNQEKQDIPVVKAGYYKENNWIYYMGVFETGVRKSLALFHGPVQDEPQSTYSMMIGKSYQSEMMCRSIIQKNGKTCALKCQYESDYDYLQKYKNSPENTSKMSFLLLGNVNLRICYPKIEQYFHLVFPKIRCVSIPDRGRESVWDHRILCALQQRDNLYWAVPLGNRNSGSTLLDILTYQPNNKIIRISQGCGYCFSGYLVKKEEVEREEVQKEEVQRGSTERGSAERKY